MPITCAIEIAVPKNTNESMAVIGLPRSKIEVAVVALTDFRPVYHVTTYNKSKGVEINIQLNCFVDNVEINESLPVKNM